MWLKKRRERRRQQEREVRQTKRREELLQLLAQAEAGQLTDRDIDFLGSADEALLSKNQRKRWRKARNHLWAEAAFPRYLEQLKPYLEDYTKKRGTLDELSVLVNFIHYYKQVSFGELYPRLEEELGYGIEGLKKLLEQAVEAHYQRFVAAREEPESFMQLRQLLQRTREQRGVTGLKFEGDLKRADIRELPIPDDWNELVARHYDTPHIDTFVDLPDRGPGDVRLLAADSIRTGDYTQAQIALAYCNSLKGYRAAVGDVLTAELAKLVIAHRSEDGQKVRLEEE